MDFVSAINLNPAASGPFVIGGNYIKSTIVKTVRTVCVIAKHKCSFCISLSLLRKREQLEDDTRHRVGVSDNNVTTPIFFSFFWGGGGGGLTIILQHSHFQIVLYGGFSRNLKLIIVEIQFDPSLGECRLFLLFFPIASFCFTLYVPF